MDIFFNFFYVADSGLTRKYWKIVISALYPIELFPFESNYELIYKMDIFFYIFCFWQSSNKKILEEYSFLAS